MAPFFKSICRRSCLAAATLALATQLPADPRDEAYWRTFYLTPIGAWGAEDPVPATPESAAYPFGIGNVQEYRNSMLSLTDGEEPLNLRVGISNQIQFLAITQGTYYDWIYEPNYGGDLWMLRRESQRHDIPFGVHLNGFPWADSHIQSDDNLGNHLETVDNGLYLARNRNAFFGGTPGTSGCSALGNRPSSGPPLRSVWRADCWDRKSATAASRA